MRHEAERENPLCQGVNRREASKIITGSELAYPNADSLQREPELGHRIACGKRLYGPRGATARRDASGLGIGRGGCESDGSVCRTNQDNGGR